MIVIYFLILIFLIYVTILLAYSMLFGAPYAALSPKRIATMMQLLEPKGGKRFLDLGAGDGRIVLEASKRGLISYGYEINPLLVVIANLNLKKNKSDGKILLQDYWKIDLSNFDYISVWGAPFMMRRLEKKLMKELKPGTRVVSNHFKFSNWQAAKEKNDVYLYIKTK